MAFTQKPTKTPEAEKPHPPKTQSPAKDWPTRDGEPYGDPIPKDPGEANKADEQSDIDPRDPNHPAKHGNED